MTKSELYTPEKLMDLLETAWGVIANAGRGDWNVEHPEWRDAAVSWRDRYDATASAWCADRGELAVSD